MLGPHNCMMMISQSIGGRARTVRKLLLPGIAAQEDVVETTGDVKTWLASHGGERI